MGTGSYHYKKYVHQWLSKSFRAFLPYVNVNIFLLSLFINIMGNATHTRYIETFPVFSGFMPKSKHSTEWSRELLWVEILFNIVCLPASLREWVPSRIGLNGSVRGKKRLILNVKSYLRAWHAASQVLRQWGEKFIIKKKSGLRGFPSGDDMTKGKRCGTEGDQGRQQKC